MLRSHLLVEPGAVRGEGKANVGAGREGLITAGTISVCKVSLVTVLCCVQEHSFPLHWYMFLRLIKRLEKIQTRCFVLCLFACF